MSYTDGRTVHPLYPRWVALCRHGSRVHPLWLTDPFEFFAYVHRSLGPPPPGHYVLGLRDPAGRWEPGNVEWMSRRAWQRSLLRVKAR